MKFIHAADLHLGASLKLASFQRELGQSRRTEIWRSFYRLIDDCNKKDVDLLLIAGDLFEENLIVPSEVKRIADCFERLKKTKVFIVGGNHDYIGESSYYDFIDFPDNVKIFEPDKIDVEEIEELNTRVYGFSWGKRTYAEDNLVLPELDKDKFNILLLHCDLDTKSEYLSINSRKIINSGFDYIALGHIHKMIQVSSNVFYPGSLEPLDFGEKGKHGYIFGEIKDGKKKFQFVNIALREFEEIKIDVTDKKSITEIEDEILEKSKEKIDKNLYRIYFFGAKSELINLQETYNLLKDQFFYVEFIDKTVPDYDFDLLYNENKDNIMGYFIADMKKKAEIDSSYNDVIYEGVNALLRGGVKE